MDECTKELIAIGAAAAVNCRPCIEHHLAVCDRLGIAREDARAALDVGMAVNRGAASRTRDNVRSMLGAGQDDTRPGDGCDCAA